ncbi:MAG: hypothetical protein OXM61_00850 [Candidatus Poribacteria bacterium]|nr:hypothetical protein [Candidatus Poribacteria bacterium]
METQKILVNPEPVSDDSEKTAEAEALEGIRQQEYDKAQLLCKKCQDDPIFKEWLDNLKDEEFQLCREIMAESPDEFLKSKKLEARFIKMMSEQSPEFREHIAAKVRQVIPSKSREKAEAVMKFLKITDTDEPSKSEEKKRNETKS